MGRFCNILFLLAFFAFSACTNNSPNTPDNSNDTPPDLPDLAALTIAIPQNAPTDIQGMVIAANSLTGLGNAYLKVVTDTSPTFENGKWTWTYTKGSLTITVIAVPNTDGTVGWELILDGKDTITNTDFNNWTAITGASSQDGSNGSWVLYNLNSTQIAANASWQTDAQGNITVALTTDIFNVDAQANRNGSGEIIIVQNRVKIYEATWTAAGGTWIAYDPTTGQQTNSGSWTN